MRLRRCFEKHLLIKRKPYDEAVIRREITNARRHLKNAQACIEEGLYDLAIVSVYTTMFHAGRSLLQRDGIKERGHVCLIEYLKETYPRLKEHIKTMDSYRRSRHTMLYGLDVDIMAEDAQTGVLMSKQFIEAIEREHKKPQKSKHHTKKDKFL